MAATSSLRRPKREVYPETQEYKVHPPASLADILEGAGPTGIFYRCLHRRSEALQHGATSAAVFGKKDYQQLLVIRDMVRQLALPIETRSGETIRDSTGLALSSRNGYLSGQVAHRGRLSSSGAEHRAAAALKSGRTDWAVLEREASDALTARGWRPDYVAIRNRRRPSAIRQPAIVWSFWERQRWPAPGSSIAWKSSCP